MMKVRFGDCVFDSEMRQLRRGEAAIDLPPKTLLLLLALPSGKVSRRHARIRVARDEAVLEDLGSKNGSYVDGRRITGPTPLGDGDEVRLGSVLVVFRSRPAAGSTETAAER